MSIAMAMEALFTSGLVGWAAGAIVLGFGALAVASAAKEAAREAADASKVTPVDDLEAVTVAMPVDPDALHGVAVAAAGVEAAITAATTEPDLTTTAGEVVVAQVAAQANIDTEI